MEQDVIKIDLKDKKILYELDSNCRQPCSKIAKKVGLSTDAVSHRIKKFEENGVILQYIPIVNFSKLGIIKFKILISLQDITPKRLNYIIDKLKKNKNVTWLVLCTGSWDLIICLKSDSLENINNLKDKILNLFSNHIARKAICVNMDANMYQKNFLIKDESSLSRNRIVSGTENRAILDELNIKILKKLSGNARKPIVNISSELRQSARVINYRIKQLTKNKIITGFNVVLNNLKLGIKAYKLFIYLKNPNNEKIKEIIHYFESNKNIVYYVRTFGDWDLEAQIEAYSEEEFNQTTEEIKDKFSAMIRHIDIVILDKVHKSVYL